MSHKLAIWALSKTVQYRRLKLNGPGGTFGKIETPNPRFLTPAIAREMQLTENSNKGCAAMILSLQNTYCFILAVQSVDTSSIRVNPAFQRLRSQLQKLLVQRTNKLLSSPLFPCFAKFFLEKI